MPRPPLLPTLAAAALLAAAAFVPLWAGPQIGPAPAPTDPPAESPMSEYERLMTEDLGRPAPAQAERPAVGDDYEQMMMGVPAGSGDYQQLMRGNDAGGPGAGRRASGGGDSKTRRGGVVSEGDAADYAEMMGMGSGPEGDDYESMMMGMGEKPGVPALVAAVARAAGDERDAAERKLTDALAEQFDARQTAREKELAALEAKVKKLRDLHDKRAAAKDEIVARRADTLLREAAGLGWGEPERGRGFGGFEIVDVPAGGFGGDYGGMDVGLGGGGLGGDYGAMEMDPGGIVYGGSGMGMGGGGVGPGVPLPGEGGGYDDSGFGGFEPAPSPAEEVEWAPSPLEGEVTQIGRRGDGGEQWVRLSVKSGLSLGTNSDPMAAQAGDVFEIRSKAAGADAPPIARMTVETSNAWAAGPIEPGSLAEGAEVRVGDRAVRVPDAADGADRGSADAADAAEPPGEKDDDVSAADAFDALERRFGLGVEFVDAAEARDLRVMNFTHGMRVARVRPIGSAARAGVEPGDLLVGLHDFEVRTQANLARVLSIIEQESAAPVRFDIVRDGERLYGFFPQRVRKKNGPGGLLPAPAETTDDPDIGGEGVQMLFFSSDSSAPDLSIRPTVERMQEEGLPIVTVKTDERPDLMQRYGVTGVPTFILLRNGEETWRSVGVPGGDAAGLARRLRDKVEPPVISTKILGFVTDASGGQKNIWVGRGSDDGLKKGDELDVLNAGGDIVGRVRLRIVTADTATGEVVLGTESVKEGMTVRSRTE